MVVAGPGSRLVDGGEEEAPLAPLDWRTGATPAPASLTLPQ